MEKNSAYICSIYKQVLQNDVLFILNIHKNGSFKKDMKEKYFKLCFYLLMALKLFYHQLKNIFNRIPEP